MRTVAWALVLLLVLPLATSRRGLAFSSFEIFGGAYHRRITEEALGPLGFQSKPLAYISQGLLEPDKFYRDMFMAPEHHFTEMEFEKNVAFLNERLAALVFKARGCQDDYQLYRETLTLFGSYLHTTQDFYAHTNWVERQLVGGAEEIPLADLHSLETMEGLACPYFLYTALPPAEVVDTEVYRVEFATDFYSAAELDRLDADERIRLISRPEKALVHRFMAKDDPDYPQSPLRWVEGGPTLFEHAYDAAVRDSRAQWQRLEEELLAAYGSRGERIRDLLQNGWLSDLPPPDAGEEAGGLRIARATLEVDEGLEFRVRLELVPEFWNQSMAAEAVDLFHLLAPVQVAHEEQPRPGISGLQFRKDSRRKSFELVLQADLHGVSRTFIVPKPVNPGRPEGSWEVAIDLPAKFRSARFEVTSPGPSRLLDGTRVLLERPENGWALPDWIDDFVAP